MASPYGILLDDWKEGLVVWLPEADDGSVALYELSLNLVFFFLFGMLGDSLCSYAKEKDPILEPAERGVGRGDSQKRELWGQLVIAMSPAYSNAEVDLLPPAELLLVGYRFLRT